jgi:hypothetical protein
MSGSLKLLLRSECAMYSPMVRCMPLRLAIFYFVTCSSHL